MYPSMLFNNVTTCTVRVLGHAARLNRNFSRSGCFVIKPLDVSSYWEAVSRSASQILWILESPQLHYLSTNTPPSEPVSTRDTGLLRSTIMLSCHLYLGLPLVSSLQVFFLYLFLVFPMRATFHMANV